LDNNVVPSAESMFVWTENSVIQRNQALNFAIFRP